MAIVWRMVSVVHNKIAASGKVPNLYDYELPRTYCGIVQYASSLDWKLPPYSKTS
jgi:hypothetical protein